jgi:hypothetical protein
MVSDSVINVLAYSQAPGALIIYTIVLPDHFCGFIVAAHRECAKR